MFSNTLCYAQHPVSLRTIFPSHLGLRFFIAMQIQYCTLTSTPLYSSINGLYDAQNPVFEIVHQESVIVYLHMYNRNVYQYLLYAASCATKDLPISPRFSPTIFLSRSKFSILLRAHICTAVLIGSMRRTLCSNLFIRRA